MSGREVDIGEPRFTGVNICCNFHSASFAMPADEDIPLRVFVDREAAIAIFGEQRPRLLLVISDVVETYGAQARPGTVLTRQNRTGLVEAQRREISGTLK